MSETWIVCNGILCASKYRLIFMKRLLDKKYNIIISPENGAISINKNDGEMFDIKSLEFIQDTRYIDELFDLEFLKYFYQYFLK